MGIRQPINGWIFQRTSELGARDHALNSSRFPFRFDRAPIYRSLLEIPSLEFDEIFVGCVDTIPRNFNKAIVKTTLKEVVAADTNSLSRKTARSPEGNVDIEPSCSMDDSPMILIEIGVGVDEGPRPNMTIGGRA